MSFFSSCFLNKSKFIILNKQLFRKMNELFTKNKHTTQSFNNINKFNYLNNLYYSRLIYIIYSPLIQHKQKYSYNSRSNLRPPRKDSSRLRNHNFPTNDTLCTRKRVHVNFESFVCFICEFVISDGHQSSSIRSFDRTLSAPDNSRAAFGAIQRMTFLYWSYNCII